MTNEQKNKFIVEKVLGECWHEWNKSLCTKCGLRIWDERHIPKLLDFYSPSPKEQAINFFRLLNCIKEKEWFPKILDRIGALHILDNYPMQFPPFIQIDYISCSALADAVIEFKKGEEDA